VASNSDAIAEGPHSLAQQTHLTKSLAGASVFDRNNAQLKIMAYWQLRSSKYDQKISS